MFKQGSYADEIFKSMESNLVDLQSSDKSKTHKLAKAALFLKQSSDIFKQAGLTKEADFINSILKDIK